MIAGEFTAYYGNWKSLGQMARKIVSKHDEDQSEIFGPRLYVVKKGHYVRVLFDEYSNSEAFGKVISGLVHENIVKKYDNHSLEEELSSLH